ncbi:uncharacterized protein LOC110984375 [Acanthaster planci]|uniref:Uncharacterized protein LOC110984375 n=1 Tax=Acanthaster planci TaxID=133434 RepID=A0A8B7ZAD9_ACAPL|nr:uncharacterized protein LOC110984375 [Acanthaster planci]
MNTKPVLSIYKGIPYAEAPIGQLRFAKPQPKRPWLSNGTALDATEYGPICIPGLFGQGMYRTLSAQPPTVSQSEDCLTLNIFVPDAVVADEGPLPVMVWIHGGGFVTGTGSNTDGSVLAEVGRVLVVTLNYRLGVFGFFSTGDDAAPGNYGLWDQRLAIIWVKDNIASFGGDSERITLFGLSAGGKGVAMQTATPVNNRTLFKRAISQSGATDDSAVNSPETAAMRSRQLADLLGCSDSMYSTHLVDCVRRVSAKNLAEASNQLPVEFVDFSPFYPTIDGEFFPDYIPNVLTAGHLGQYDFLTGVNSNEGTLAQSSDKIPSSIESYEQVSAIIEELLVSTFCKCTNAREAADEVAFYYTSEQGSSDGRLNRGAILDAFADVLYTAPCLNNVNLHVKANLTSRGSTYLYFFPYRPEDEPSSEPDIITGAGHGAEVPYVFGDHLRDSPGTEKGNLSSLILRYWANFARNGNPNEDGIPYWPLYDLANESYIILQPDIDRRRRLQAGQVAAWLDYLPRIIDPSDPNKCSLDVPMPSLNVSKHNRTRTVEVTNRNGEMLGTVVGEVRLSDHAMGGLQVACFMGIPYAEPPVGGLRFKPPKPASSLGEKPLDLRGKVPAACPQNTTKDPWMARIGFNTTSEDCLTLNVYAPVDGEDDTTLPVVVMVHSGDLKSGTSSVYEANLLASMSEAVVVSFNYRLGPLGFLSTEDVVSPGNYGLYDALAVLQWVNKFIGSFGGDPTQVTLLGHGAGSILAHLLVMTDETTRGLIKRAVSLSGTVLSPYMQNPVQSAPLDRAKALAEKVGCTTEKSEAMVECLRHRPAADLVDNTPELSFSFPFPIVVDGNILKESPSEILQSGMFQDVEFIFGIVQDEQAALAASFLEDPTRCPTEEEVEQLIGTICKESLPNPDVASLALTTEYLDNGRHKPEDKNCSTRGAFRRFLHDYLTVAPTLQAALHHASTETPVHLYTFDHIPMDRYQAGLPHWAGAAFGDDLQFLFGEPYSSQPQGESQKSYRLKDKKTTLELMYLLSNFVHKGSAGVPKSVFAWPHFERSELCYLSVDPCPEARSGVDDGWKHKLRFWSELLATVAKPRPTLSDTTSMPSDPVCIIGTLGLEISPETASLLIEILLGVSVAIFAILMTLAFSAC